MDGIVSHFMWRNGGVEEVEADVYYIYSKMRDAVFQLVLQKVPSECS